MFRFVRTALLAGIVAMLAGCVDAYPPNLVPAVPSRSVAPEFYRPQPATSYAVSPGDKLEVNSYYHPALKQDVTVLPDGRASLLLLGSVVVAGKTPQQLSHELTRAYAKYVDNAEITATVTYAAGLSAYVGGEVAKPSLVAINGDLTLLQGITEAGGFLNTANKGQVLIVRRMADSHYRTLQEDVERVLRNQSPEIYLRPHDIVYVPKTEIAKADQFVDQFLNRLVPRWVVTSFGASYLLNPVASTSTSTTTTSSSTVVNNSVSP